MKGLRSRSCFLCSERKPHLRPARIGAWGATGRVRSARTGRVTLQDTASSSSGPGRRPRGSARGGNPGGPSGAALPAAPRPLLPSPSGGDRVLRPGSRCATAPAAQHAGRGPPRPAGSPSRSEADVEEPRLPSGPGEEPVPASRANPALPAAHSPWRCCPRPTPSLPGRSPAQRRPRQRTKWRQRWHHVPGAAGLMPCSSSLPTSYCALAGRDFTVTTGYATAR